MKLLFKQRMFSWFDSYDIYDENENTVYVVKGQLSWGHCLKIFDTEENELGTVKQEVLTWLPKFELYEGENYTGLVQAQVQHRFQRLACGGRFPWVGLHHYKAGGRDGRNGFQGAAAMDRHLCAGYR